MVVANTALVEHDVLGDKYFHTFKFVKSICLGTLIIFHKYACLDFVVKLVFLFLGYQYIVYAFEDREVIDLWLVFCG